MWQPRVDGGPVLIVSSPPVAAYYRRDGAYHDGMTG
jgi:hypothetical protein